MEQYLKSQYPNQKNSSGGIVPPLNTDIRFSNELQLHHVSEEDMPYTTVVTNGANTPMIDMEDDLSFSKNLKLHKPSYSYNPRDYNHLAEEHPKAFHIHHTIPAQFSWCLPDSSDSKLLKIKKTFISKPKTQYACGSCFAICVAQVFSDCLVVSGAVGWAPNISETWIMANLPANVQNGCGGGNPAVIAPILEKYGVLDSSCVDYSWCENDKKLCASMSSTRHFDAQSLTTKLNNNIPRNGCWFSQRRFLYKLDKGSNVFFINPEAPRDVFVKTVKTHIYDFGPCVGGFVVLSNFMSGKHTNPKLATRGIYFEKCHYDGWLGLEWGSPGKPEGLHAIAIVGWGSEDNVEYTRGKFATVPYWHCRNSWGQDWGYQEGMFKMAMYPFNKYSQFDKEVMTSIGGPVGSMVLVRATKPPVVVETKQVEDRYRSLRRTLPDLYYQATPEEVVKFNRQALGKELESTANSSKEDNVPEDNSTKDITFDILPDNSAVKKLIFIGIICCVCVILYIFYK